MTDLPLTKLAETATTITLGWTPPPGALGYVLYLDGVRRSSSWDPGKNTWKVGKGDGVITVAALDTLAEGTYPPVVTPPPPPVSGIAGGVGLDLNGSRWPGGLSGSPNLITVSADNAKDAAAKHSRVLMYVDAPSIREQFWTGVDYATARSKGLILERAAKSAYGAWCGNLTLPAYQDEWAKQVIARAKAAGVWGVFVDDVVQNVNGLHAGAYPTWQGGRDAMVDFVAATLPKLTAAGLYVVANADGFVSRVGGDDGQLQIEWWKLLKPYAPALMQECWQQDPNDYSRMRTTGWGYWSGWQSLCKWAGDNGVQFVGLTYGSSANVEYARASALTANPGAVVMSTASGAWARKPGVVSVNPALGVGSLG